MLHKMGLTLLCATALFTSTAFATTEHLLSSSSTYPLEFPSNDPQIITNSTFFTIKATCTVISDVQDNALSFTVLRKSGSLNGGKLTVGESMDIIVHPGEKLHITAVSGARMEMTNHGENTVKANCMIS